MAVLQTTEDFRKAIAYLQSVNYFGSVVLSLVIGDMVAECEVLDDATLTDITPNTVTLESALDSANAEIAANSANQITDLSEREQLLNLAEIAIVNIASDRQAIATGLTALAAATTLAQVKPIVQGMLSIQDSTLNRQDRIIKALRAVLRSGLGSA